MEHKQVQLIHAYFKINYFDYSKEIYTGVIYVTKVQKFIQAHINKYVRILLVMLARQFPTLLLFNDNFKKQINKKEREGTEMT